MSSHYLLAFLSLLTLAAGTSQPLYPLERGHLVEELSKEFSNEGKGTSGTVNYPVGGILCLGNFCDKKKLITYKRTDSPILFHEENQITAWTSPFRRPANCPDGMVVNEMKCSGAYCAYIKLGCARPTGDYFADSNEVKYSEYFSEETGKGFCPDTYYIAGIACKGSFCDELKLKCVRMYTKVPFIVERKICRVLEAPDSFRSWTPYFSDENGGYSVAVKKPIDGFFCNGKFCDNKTLRTLDKDQEDIMEEKGSKWSNFISEEGKNQVICPESYVVSQIECSGDYCDNMRIRCSPVKKGFYVQFSDKEVDISYGAVTAEKGVHVPLCPYGEYMVGLQCFGNYRGFPVLVCKPILCQTEVPHVKPVPLHGRPFWHRL